MFRLLGLISTGGRFSGFLEISQTLEEPPNPQPVAAKSER
jgi:hypothetical protein